MAAARTPALLLQIDDVVYDMLEHEEGWEVGDVIEAVERRLDFMVIHGTALYPHEAATRMLTPTFVRQRIQAAQSRKPFFGAWTRWSLGAAAASAAIVAVFWVNRPEALPALADRTAHSPYIQKVSSRLAAVLGVGLRDHIHCAVFRRYPLRNPPTVEKMERELGPSYQGLLPVVRAAVPEGYQIVLAHQCDYLKRKYVHFTMTKGSSVLSLVVARKQDGESFDELRATAGPDGIPIYQSGVDRYRIAAFDAGKFLAYVISDMPGKANLQVASTLAPTVRDFLLKAGA